jgi:hypothetical protein
MAKKKKKNKYYKILTKASKIKAKQKAIKMKDLNL